MKSALQQMKEKVQLRIDEFKNVNLMKKIILIAWVLCFIISVVRVIWMPLQFIFLILQMLIIGAFFYWLLQEKWYQGILTTLIILYLIIFVQSFRDLELNILTRIATPFFVIAIYTVLLCIGVLIGKFSQITMNRQKGMILRMICCTSAIAIVAVLFSLHLSFNGSEIMKLVLRNGLIEEAKRLEPNHKLSFSDASYAFTEGRYMISVTDEEVEDSNFTVSVSPDGKQYFNEYEWLVKQRYNTIFRNEMAYREFIEKIIDPLYGKQLEMGYGSFAVDDAAIDAAIKEVELGEDFDFKNPKVPSRITIWLFSEKRDAEELATQLIRLAVEMKKQGVRIDTVSFTLRNPEVKGDDYGVYDFPMSEILKNENLVELIKSLETNQGFYKK